MTTNPTTLEEYHAIEKILTDFKNGATYSDSIEKVQELLTANTRETLDKVYEKIQYMYPILYSEDIYQHTRNISRHNTLDEVKAILSALTPPGEGSA